MLLHTCGYSLVGKAPAFQAGNASSSLATRSDSGKCHVIMESAPPQWPMQTCFAQHDKMCYLSLRSLMAKQRSHKAKMVVQFSPEGLVFTEANYWNMFKNMIVLCKHSMSLWLNGKALVCKTRFCGFKSRWRLEAGIMEIVEEWCSRQRFRGGSQQITVNYRWFSSLSMMLAYDCYQIDGIHAKHTYCKTFLYMVE